MAGHLLKAPGRLRWSFGSFDSGTPTLPTPCTIRGKKILVPIANALLRAEQKLRHGFVPVSGNSSRREGFGLGFGLGLRGRPVVLAGEGETSESDVVPSERIRDETIEPAEENSSFPAAFQGLTVHRRDPPNLFLYAAGFCVIVLMRDVVLREVAGWGISFDRIALYITEGIAIGLGKLTNVLAEPIAFLMTFLSWAIMAVTDIYTLIVDYAPVKSLFHSLLLSVAVLSIGDATACRVRGSRTRLVGISTVIGVAGALEFIPPEAVLLCLILLTAFAKLIQKADLVTVFMPTTVILVAISEPILRAAAFAIFLAVSVYANWRFVVEGSPEFSEPTASEAREMEVRGGKRLSFVFSLISASIGISWAARMLYLRSVKWLVLRSA